MKDTIRCGPLVELTPVPAHARCSAPKTSQALGDVLRILVQIVDDAAATFPSTASSATVLGSQPETQPSTQAWSHRIEVALAVGEAFDNTLVSLAQALRGSYNDSRWKSSSSRLPLSTLRRLSGAGLYLEAHELVLTSILEAFASHDSLHQSTGPPARQPSGGCDNGPRELPTKRQEWFQGELRRLGETMYHIAKRQGDPVPLPPFYVFGRAMLG